MGGGYNAGRGIPFFAINQYLSWRKRATMKKLGILFLFLSLAQSLSAQELICEPERNLPDSTVFLYPQPATDDSPTGGIGDTACLNTSFLYNLTIRVPSRLPVGGMSTVSPTQFVLDEDQGLINLPAGLDYRCYPPSCTFEVMEAACLLIYGTPAAQASTGAYDIQLNGELRTTSDTIQLQFPGPELLDGGKYRLAVREENHPGCARASTTREPFANQLQLRNRPNPFSDITQILIQSKVAGEFFLQIYDLTGTLQDQQLVRVFPGLNQIEYDGSRLPEGFFIYSLTDGFQAVAGKMLIQR